MKKAMHGFLRYGKILPSSQRNEDLSMHKANDNKRKDYHKILAERYERTDWSDLWSIKAYNEFARRLRSELEWEEADYER